MDKLKLESIMKLHGDTGTSLAQYLGIARSTFSAKINEKNGFEFNKREIGAMREKYGLSDSEIVSIFFAKKVS